MASADNKLLLTVDVEGGEQPDRYKTIPALQQFLNELSIEITLFITPDVVKRRTDTVRGWLNSDHNVGLHIHPARFDGFDSDWLTDYDRDDIDELVATGIDVFEDQIGYQPDIFRAGRWEFSQRLLDVLESRDFTLDASRRPREFRLPYRHGELVELPLSTYSNILTRIAMSPWDLGGISLHADSYSKRRLFIPGLYVATKRLMASEMTFIVVAFHDYDVINPALRRRMKRYINWLSEKIPVEDIYSVSQEI